MTVNRGVRASGLPAQPARRPFGVLWPLTRSTCTPTRRKTSSASPTGAPCTSLRPATTRPSSWPGGRAWRRCPLEALAVVRDAWTAAATRWQKSSSGRDAVQVQSHRVRKRSANDQRRSMDTTVEAQVRAHMPAPVDSGPPTRGVLRFNV